MEVQLHAFLASTLDGSELLQIEGNVGNISSTQKLLGLVGRNKNSVWNLLSFNERNVVLPYNTACSSALHVFTVSRSTCQSTDKSLIYCL
jgi:hypothetical protein